MRRRQHICVGGWRQLLGQQGRAVNGPKELWFLSPSDNLGGTTVVAEAEAMMSLFSQFFRVVDLWAGKGTR